MRLLRSWGWVLLPLALHLCLSWISFNPTDEGWAQAVTRRLLDGQVPHRDFILCRPAVWHYLQIPLLLWGGDWTLWLFRLWGWLTIAAIAWLWSGWALPTGRQGERWQLYALGTMLGAHGFPVTAWHTLDSMVLASLAVLYSHTPGGFLAAGVAPLFRQNFVLLGPFLLAVHPRRWKWLLLFGLPSLLWLAALFACGGLRDFLMQTSALKGAFWQSAVMVYVYSAPFWIGLAAGLLLRRWLFLVVCFLLSWSLFVGGGAYLGHSFGLFGVVLGLVLRHHSAPGWKRSDLVVLVFLPWSAAISHGYNNPALASAILMCGLYRLAPPSRRVLTTSLVVVGFGFLNTRLYYPYRDRPVWDLTCSVGEAVRGGSGLTTNSQTYAALLDLRQLTDRFAKEGRLYAIFTDYSMHWIYSKQANPLPVECAQIQELGASMELFQRLQTSVLHLPTGSRVIVQKHYAERLPFRLELIPNTSNWFYPQIWVGQNLPQVGETTYFRVYEPPAGESRPGSI